MTLLNKIREKISPQNALLLFYHQALAVIAAVWRRFPANRLIVIAVTGTKGKSTTAHLIASILRKAGFKAGLASTIEFQIGDDVWINDTKQTTQGPWALQRLLRRMVRARLGYAVLEVTSHALSQSRLWGVNVDVAALTNISNDHIEYHGGFEMYLRAKGKLFAMLSRAPRKRGFEKTAVLPVGDPHVAYFMSFTADRQITYGIAKGMIFGTDVVLRADSSSFTLKAPNSEIAVNLKLPGEFNVRNAICAAAAALACGVKLPAIKEGLEVETCIPGRLEMIHSGQPFSVVVDYAHTEDSLEKLLSLFRPLTKGRLILVFGCTGGGRDAGKRAKMGEIAARFADYIIVTDDDPYTENRMSIIEQVSNGISKKEGDGFWKVRDRKSAIRLACLIAREDDVVIIAGKGSEPIQIIGEEKIPWDDRAVARQILSREIKLAL